MTLINLKIINILEKKFSWIAILVLAGVVGVLASDDKNAHDRIEKTKDERIADKELLYNAEAKLTIANAQLAQYYRQVIVYQQQIINHVYDNKSLHTNFTDSTIVPFSQSGKYPVGKYISPPDDTGVRVN